MDRKKRQVERPKKRQRPSTVETGGLSASNADIPVVIYGQIDEMVKKIMCHIQANHLDSVSMLGNIMETSFQDMVISRVYADQVLTILKENGGDVAANLRELLVAKYLQQKRAERVFSLIDEAGKGIVVVEDLVRIASDIMGEEITEEQLMEMINEFDRSGDGMLSKDDIITIANLVGL